MPNALKYQNNQKTLKIRQTNKKTTLTFGALPNNGFTIVKNPPKLIQIAPTIFHPTLGNNY
jgi:hypothetical protein